MKKLVVVILLIMPFVLIYFISFTGRVLSIYSHINVENIVVIDNNKNLENNYWLQLNKGEEREIDIKLLPELSSNKEYVVSNSSKNVCTFDEGKITALDYGVSKIIITSKDRHFVQFVLNVSVVEKDVKSIVVNKDKIELNVGKFELLDIEILPSSVVEENRELEYISLDEEIATINSNIVTGVSVGNTKIVIKSKHNPDVYTEIDVNVTDYVSQGVFFDYNDTSKVYDVYDSVFDLKSITSINVEGVGFDDIIYSLDTFTDAVDTSLLGSGIIKFNKDRVPIVISLMTTHNDNVYTDTITLRYVTK